MKIMTIRPVPVTFIPPLAEMRRAELYISSEYSTASHLCCCGCGEEVVTPLNPAKWSLSLRNGLVTMFPSIGNWQYACKSHYFIKNNRVIWQEEYSPEEIRLVQKQDDAAVEHFIVMKSKKCEPEGIRYRVPTFIKSIIDKFFR